MCGIAGIIGKDSSKEQLLKMLTVQSHRGPDYTGIWCDKSVALGHNRLSIIDLSVNANQPFKDNFENYILVFNGEIYNYLEIKQQLATFYNFKTESDTEVLLAAYLHWGKDCLSKLNGMFSFAIWHVKEKKLFAARDRFGVKPFYYIQKDEVFRFASEIKTLTHNKKKQLNEKVWANYFAFGSYGMPNETFFENINQLPAGHYLEFSSNKLKVTKWYFFEQRVKSINQKLTYSEAKNKYVDLLEQSIQLRFRADVPVGFNVSGGVDSSILLAFVNKITRNKKIKAYTFFTNDKNYDEVLWVEKLLKITNNPLEKVLLNYKDVTQLINEINFYQDEPYGGLPTIAYSQIFKKARQQNTLVLLDGQGMDEQWAGYDYYVKNNQQIIQGVNSSPFKTNVLKNDFFANAEKSMYPTPFQDAVQNKQFRDLFYTKIPRALRFNDRISMAYSTELREPFLDYNLVEFAFAQPLEYKIKDGIQKKMLRDIAVEYLGKQISYAPKRPLQTPQREWLSTYLKSYVEEKLEFIANSAYKDWFKVDDLQKEWLDYLNGNNQSSFHIWQWTSLPNL